MSHITLLHSLNVDSKQLNLVPFGIYLVSVDLEPQ